MNKPEPITKGQMRMLQSLWTLYVTDENSAQDRAARLRWASRNIGREIASFNDLTKAEAKSLIDIAQMGLERVP